MTTYLWLVWYRAQSPLGPKHWSLFVTYEPDEEALGTIYQVRLTLQPPPLSLSNKRPLHLTLITQLEGNGWGTGQFVFRVCRGVQLKGARGSQAYESRLHLGDIRDGVNGMLQEYCEAAAELINEHNTAHVIGDSNCQDWCLLVVKSLEDARFVPAGTYAKAKACPRK